MRGLGPMSIPNVVDILDSVKCYINIVSKGKIIIIIKTYQKGLRHDASRALFVIDGTTMVAVGPKQHLAIVWALLKGMAGITSAIVMEAVATIPVS